jgi:hypothetical protein
VKVTLRERIINIGEREGVDVAIQKEGLLRRSKRLVCFDMDKTLIDVEVIDELADISGVGEQVKAITESAMRGDIDFDTSLKRRVALLKGADRGVFDKVRARIKFTPGAADLCKVLCDCASDCVHVEGRSRHALAFKGLEADGYETCGHIGRVHGYCQVRVQSAPHTRLLTAQQVGSSRARA